MITVNNIILELALTAGLLVVQGRGNACGKIVEVVQRVL
jgi:hypothetical protein